MKFRIRGQREKDTRKEKKHLASYTEFGPAIPALKQVKNIICIASGKGGVGKSTVASNLAVYLKNQGQKVGLLDGDIYGPSQPKILGTDENQRPVMQDNMIVPAEHRGIKLISMGLLMDKDAALIWRAPMAMKAITQFLGQVNWGELDYLLIDLPPGTGDVQITLSQQAYLTGAILVTTPQDVAINVAQKGFKDV